MGGREQHEGSFTEQVDERIMAKCRHGGGITMGERGRGGERQETRSKTVEPENVVCGCLCVCGIVLQSGCWSIMPTNLRIRNKTTQGEKRGAQKKEKAEKKTNA